MGLYEKVYERIKKTSEGNAPTITVCFFDKNDLPVPPTSAQYNIIDEKSGTVLQDWVEIPIATTPLTSYDIDIPLNCCMMVDPNSEYEERIITITWISGDNQPGSGEYKFNIKKLEGLNAVT
jgi:hypothetical protein